LRNERAGFEDVLTYIAIEEAGLDLSRFSLFRNDPQAAAEVLEHALQGDVDAQFAAGLVYAEGRGVPVDLVQSFYWFSKAVAQGDADAKRLRVIIGSRMSEEEYQKARHLLAAEAKAGQWGGDESKRH
jgi:TPR repeat protein